VRVGDLVIGKSPPFTNRLVGIVLGTWGGSRKIFWINTDNSKIPRRSRWLDMDTLEVISESRR